MSKHFGNRSTDAGNANLSFHNKWYDNINGNVVLYLSWVLMVVAICGLTFLHFSYKQQIIQANIEQHQWSVRSDRARALRTTQVVVPSKKAGDLTPREGQTVAFLSKLFTDSMTYDSQTSYDESRRYAKRYVTDPQFFKVFFPRVDENFISTSGIKGVAQSVDVYPMGGTRYLVIAAYLPYNHRSDLNQRNALTSINYVFDVTASNHQVSSCKQLSQFGGDFNVQVG